MDEKTVTITNGTGSLALDTGTYSVTSNVPGYSDATINPDSVTITDQTSTYAFTIAATGTLTLHVTEDGTSSGTPIIGATFIRTSQDGSTTYGSVITTDSNGDAIFENVPFIDTTGIDFYYKQTASDGNHSFVDTVQTTSLTTSTTTLQVENPVFNTYNFTLNDSNYNMPIASGTLTLS